MATSHIAPKRKTSLKDSWWVLVLVPLVVALVPVFSAVFEKGKAPGGTTSIQTNNFSGPMYFANVSLIERQYRETTGQPLNDGELKKKIEEAWRLSSAKDFAGAASILSAVAQLAPVAAVFNNLGVAYANSNELGRAEEAFHHAVERDPANSAAWVNLGMVQQKAGKLEKANESFQRSPDQSLAAPHLKAVAEGLKGHDILSARPIDVAEARPDTITANQANYFTFVTPPKYRDWIKISMTNRSTTLQPWLNLFDSEKSDISGNQYMGTSGANLEYAFVVRPSTTYYISANGLNGTAGEYTLLVKANKAYDRFEPNDDVLHAGAIEFGRAVEAGVMDSGDTDFYSFTSPGRAGNLEISVTNRSTTLQPWINVFNADRKEISGNQYDGTSGANLRYTFVAQPNSTYYVSVRGLNGTAGDYTLTTKLQ